MAIGTLLVAALFIVLVLWLINQFVPPPAKMVLTVFVALLSVLWLAQALGLLTGVIRIRG